MKPIGHIIGRLFRGVILYNLTRLLVTRLAEEVLIHPLRPYQASPQHRDLIHP